MTTDDYRDDTSIRDFNNWADTAARSRSSTHRRSGTALKHTTSGNGAMYGKKSSSSSKEVYMTMHMKTQR